MTPCISFADFIYELDEEIAEWLLPEKTVRWDDGDSAIPTVPTLDEGPNNP